MNARGFTLIELTAGLSLAAIAFVGLFALNVLNIRAMRSAREESRSMQAMEYEMEQLRTIPWSNVVAYGSAYSISGSNNPALAHLNSGGGTVTLSPEPAESTNASSRRVTITLTWASHHDSATRTNTTMSIVSEHNFLR